MNKTHEFYPMISGTVKTLINLCDNNTITFLHILREYPEINNINTNNPILSELIKELDRQYARWNKGGVK